MEKLKQVLINIWNLIKGFLWRRVIFVGAFVVVILFIGVALVFKQNTDVGGILGSLFEYFGHGQNKDAISVANAVPTSRTEAVGQEDKEGFDQAKIDTLKVSDNPFRNKDSVTLPDGTKEALPDGVKDTNVSEVMQVSGTVTITASTDNLQKSSDTQTTLDQAEKTTASAEDLLKQLNNKE